MYFFTLKSDIIQFRIIKRHIVTNYFDITRKMN